MNDDSLYSDFIGLPLEQVKQLLQERGISARYIAPDHMITMDYQPWRVNVRYNESGIVTRIYHG